MMCLKPYGLFSFQAENVKVCELDGTLKEKLRKFRFRKEKNNAAIVSKLNISYLAWFDFFTKCVRVIRSKLA